MRGIRTLANRRIAGGEEGQAAVEFAMGASVLLMALIGMMKMSMAIYTYHFVAEAAREGSRFAMVRGSSCTQISPNLTPCPAAYDGSDTSAYVKSLTYPGISAANMTVTSSYAGYPTAIFCPCNNPGNLVTVTVQYAFPLSIPFMPNKTYTMQSTSSMVISQ